MDHAVPAEETVDRTTSLLAPRYIPALAVILFLIAWTFPPSLYQEYLAEPDYMFLNLQVLFYFFACLAGYYVGAEWVSQDNSIPRRNESESETRSAVYLIIPMGIAYGMLVFYSVAISESLNAVALLSSLQGDLIKLAIRQGGAERTALDSVQPFGCVLLAWMLYRLPSIQATRDALRLLTGGVYLAAILLFLAGLLMVDRQTILFVILALFLTGVRRREEEGKMNVGSSASFGVLGLVTFIAAFFLAAALRGAGSMNELTTSLLGYSIASYNRLAAVLQGTLFYDVKHSGAFLVQYLSEGQQFNRLVPVREYFGWPSTAELFGIEFVGVARAGLNLRFNWSSMFGYLYSDIEWLAPLYMAAIGALTAAVWNSYRKGRCMGVCLYCWVIYSVLFWVGGNLLLTARFVSQIEMAVLLLFYEKLGIGREVAVPNCELVLSEGNG